MSYAILVAFLHELYQLLVSHCHGVFKHANQIAQMEMEMWRGWKREALAFRQKASFGIEESAMNSEIAC